MNLGQRQAIAVTRDSGIIVGAVSHERNKYDAHTLPEVLEQIKEPSGTEPAPWNTNIYSTGPAVAICDRGYRGVSKVGKTQILIPKKPEKDATVYRKRKARKRFRKRAGIEAIIGHLKSDFRLIRNYLKGSIGDSINLMLAPLIYLTGLPLTSKNGCGR